VTTTAAATITTTTTTTLSFSLTGPLLQNYSRLSWLLRKILGGYL